MITSAIISMAALLIEKVLSWFPASTGFPAEVETAFSSLGEYVKLFDSLVPISTLAICLSLVFGTEIIIFGFRSVKWLISHIPFIGGKA